MNQLANALDLLQTLNALRPISESQERRIWQKFRLDWNFHSNHLEGNSLTYGETKSLLLHNITAQGKPLKDHLEITGHNEALLEIQGAVKQQRPITEAFLRQVHTLILKERYQVEAQTAEGQATKKWIEVGQYKTQPNHVVTATGETFRFAEPFEVAAKMEKLVQEANSNCSNPEEGLLLAAKLHYQFVLIHPFDDGNGRMARILMNLVLMRHGFPPAIIKTQAKEEYFSALRQADGGQFEVFAEYIAGRIADSLKIMIAGAKGEEIDEPDDLDKKIALAIALARSKTQIIPAKLNEKLFVKFLNHAIVDLVKLLEAKSNKLVALYSGVTSQIRSDYSFGSSSKLSISFNKISTAKAFPNLWTSERMPYTVEQEFLELKLSNGHHDYKSTFTIDCEEYKAVVELNKQRVAETIYNDTDFENFNRKVVEAVVTEHLNWLHKTAGIIVPE